MTEQLSLFNHRSDTDDLSLQNSRSDAKRQAIQRFLNQRRTEPSFSINKYSPGRRNAEYYRLSFEWNGKKKHIHIRGGSTRSELANTKSCLNTTLKSEVKAEGRGQRAEGFKSN